jgi:2-iminobutanoate/2-iminopropanoate deaminase
MAGLLLRPAAQRKAVRMKILPFCSGVLCCAISFTGAGCTGGEASKSSETHTMTRQVIQVPDAPSSPLYSQAIKVGPDIYVTGILGVDPKTNKPAGPTIQEQTERALVNCQNILRAAGATLDDVVEVQVLLAKPEDFAGMNEAYAKFFPKNPPIRSTTRLGPELPGMLVSIKMHAVLT